MKILYITTVSVTMNFFPEHIKMLINDGHNVELACNCEKPVNQVYKDLNCKIHNLPFSRSPSSKDNIRAYKMLKELLNTEKYDIVHTHTPIASVYARLACRKVRKKGTKLFYTAHGFHFCKGAPLINWLIYYPAEWFCSFMTDKLITINKEDFTRAKKHLHAKNTYYVHGVGIDTEKFSNVIVDVSKKREELGLSKDDIMLLSVGELNKNKNHQVIIKALSKLNNKKIHYFIAGTGDLKDYLINLSGKLCIKDNVHLLGFRSDVPELCKAADIFCFPSKREGLPVSLMEAMAAGLPIVCSKIRGNTDLIKNNRGGFIYSPDDADGFAEGIKTLLENEQKCSEMVSVNSKTVYDYGFEKVLDEMRKVYEGLI